VAESDITNAKLIILYIIKAFPGIPISELTEHALSSLYMDYFSFVQALEELKRDRLVMRSVRKNEHHLDGMKKPIERCDVTPEGEAVLSFLIPKMPAGIRSYLTAATSSRRAEAKKASFVTADDSLEADGTYRVRLTLSDGIRQIAKLDLHAPDEKTANTMCQRWKTSTTDLYGNLIRSLSDLTKEDDPPEG